MLAHMIAVTVPVLRLQGLVKRYGTFTAVAGIDLEIPPGQVFGLLGPNGCGKSTTLNMVLGLLRPTAGRVEILGRRLDQHRSAALRHVGGLVEAPSFYPYLSGRENLRLLATLRNMDHGAVERALTQVQLTDHADRPFGTYSLGMKQRLGVAAALMHNPRLVVLDEPANGLDPMGARDMRKLIPTLAHGADACAVLLSSHLLHEVEQVCDSVAIMNHGRIIAQGTVQDLLHTGDRIVIDVPDAERDAAQTTLTAVPGVDRVERQGATLVAIMPGADPARLNAALAAAGIYASRLAAMPRSLETVFLDLTAEVNL